jgi:hypothetical protein
VLVLQLAAVGEDVAESKLIMTFDDARPHVRTLRAEGFAAPGSPAVA